MKRVVSILLVLVMLALACPVATLGIFAEEATVVTRYTDYSYDFTVDVSETTRNEAGLELDAYAEWLRNDAFKVDQGNGPWKVGEVSADGKTFTPFTRLVAMCADRPNDLHDINWVSTEEQYLRRIEPYIELWDREPADRVNGVQLWDNQTPLWHFYGERESDPRNSISGAGTSKFSAMVYTAEADGYVNFSMDDFSDYENHYLAILVDGEMIWPTPGGSLTVAAHMHATDTLTTKDAINAALTAANGTELKRGQQVAFVVRGGGLGVIMSPVLTEYQFGETTINLIDTYGVNGRTDIVETGSEYTIPVYQGDLIFRGWDANRDGIADYEDGATFTVPELPSLSLVALIFEPASFKNNMPTIDNGETIFHGGWTVGRYEMLTGEYIPFAANDEKHLYTPGTGGMWGGTGGGFYVTYDYGKIAMSGCTPEGAYASQIRYAVEYNGTVNVDFEQLTLGRHVNAGVAPSKLSYKLAIFKNGEKIWPAEGTAWYSYTSSETYEAQFTNYDLLAVLHANGTFPLSLEVKAGDVFDFRVQSGNEDCYQYFSKPIISYTDVKATPIISASSVTLGGSDLDINAFVTIEGDSTGAVPGVLYWTAPNENGEFLTSEADELTFNEALGCFTYEGMAAKQMADVLYVLPYVFVDGTEVIYGVIDELSIASYVEEALKTATGDLRRLLINLVNYGAEAQNFFDYNESNPANAFLSPEDTKVEKVGNLAKVYAQTGSGQKIKSVSLICGNELGFKFMTDAKVGVAAYEIEFADNAAFENSQKVDMVATELGDEYKAIVNISYTECAKTFYIRVLTDGTAGATLTYSVETFLDRTKNTTDDSFYYLTLSLVAFGRANADYAASLAE